VNVPDCTAAGVLATNTPDVLTETTADTAFALILAAARRVGEGERFLREGTPWIWGPLMMLGQDVHHKTIGVVGFGRIGQAVARRAAGFGMTVIYSDAVQLPPEVEAETGATRVELDELLERADVISIHTNLTDETRHLFSHEQFKKMKPTAVLVNTSRGPVVDEEALADALENDEIFAAGLDVFENEPSVNPRLLEPRERRRDPPSRQRDRRHAQRDGQPRRRQRVRRDRRLAAADAAEPRRVHRIAGRDVAARPPGRAAGSGPCPRRSAGHAAGSGDDRRPSGGSAEHRLTCGSA
jgi:lactate dehydrogenase-like 2-hydroxyacid dehydrogenase